MALIDVWHKTTGRKYRLGEQFVAQHPEYTTEQPAPKPAGQHAAPDASADAPAASLPDPAPAADPAPEAEEAPAEQASDTAAASA